jgi:hypothetical protein
MASPENEKIALFHGYTKIMIGENGTTLIGVNPETGFHNRIPDYTTKDIDAIKLLPFLVELGYDPSLIYYLSSASWMFACGFHYSHHYSKTISGAISEAVIELIDCIKLGVASEI